MAGIRIIGSQIGKAKDLEAVYEAAVSRGPYSYLLIDFSPDLPSKLMFRGSLPYEDEIIVYSLT